MEEEKRHLQLCRQQIEQLLGWGDSDTWGTEEYEELRTKIFEKTQVQLSVSTLKRIWGKVNYQSFPALVTLNALARFTNFDSWRDFKRSLDLNPSPGENPISADEASAPTRTRSYQISWIIGGILVFVVFLICGLSLNWKKDRPGVVTFSSRKVTDDLPNSVVFTFHAPVSSSDHIYLQQSWDPARREKITNGDSVHTSIYYHPGYFLAKLIVNDSVEKESVVFIKTKGWKGIIGKKPVPIYLSDQEIKNNGYLGITSTLLQQKTGTVVFNNTWVKFSNVKEYSRIDAGNFILNTTLRNTSTDGESVCRKTNVVILGEGSAIVVPLTTKGCTADIGLLTDDNWITGKTSDLSAFGCDFNTFQNLRCEVKKQMIKISLNNKEIFSGKQEHSLGKIVGIRIEFEGAGQIKEVKLQTPGTVPYQEI